MNDDQYNSIMGQFGKIKALLAGLKGGSPFSYKEAEVPEVPEEVLTEVEQTYLDIFKKQDNWVKENGGVLCPRLVRFINGTIKEVPEDEPIPANAIRGVHVFPHIRELGFECHSCRYNAFEGRCNKGEIDRMHPEQCTTYQEIHA